MLTERPDSLNTPPSVAPLISGLLLIKWSWPSIFWFLSVASSIVFLAILLFLPETCRQVVGNGNIPAPLMNRTIVPILSPQTSSSADVVTLRTGRKGEVDGIKAANPFSSLTLFKCRSTALAIMCYSVYYMIYSCLQASLSTIFVEAYKVTSLIAGLSYIPFGVACVLASSLAGMSGSVPFFESHLRVD
jgi:MFS family permease